MDSHSEQQLIGAAVAAYDIGTLRTVRLHSGTAAKTWRVETTRGQYLLRTRGSRSSSERMVVYDHALRNHLLDKGVPTAAPVETRMGDTAVRVDTLVLELYRIVPGATVQQASPEQIGAAATALAEFHRATGDFALARALPPVAQYATLGFRETSSRMEDPALLARVYEQIGEAPDVRPFADHLAVAERWLERLREDLPNSTYQNLPQSVTHGDFTLANILFLDSRVTGIFDFDWARWGPRVRDLADGMFFVAGQRRTPLDPANIWSLTEAVDLHVDRCALWLEGYGALSPLTRAEIDALPLALAARWLSVRVEGMAKVPPARRTEFALANLPGPLDWLDRHWSAVAKRVTD